MKREHQSKNDRELRSQIRVNNTASSILVFFWYNIYKSVNPLPWHLNSLYPKCYQTNSYFLHNFFLSFLCTNLPNHASFLLSVCLPISLSFVPFPFHISLFTFCLMFSFLSLECFTYTTFYYRISSRVSLILLYYTVLDTEMRYIKCQLTKTRNVRKLLFGASWVILACFT